MTATVLTVDDSRTMRDMLMMALSQAGFDVVEAVDGLDGIETLETGINRPRLDGFGFIEHLRKDPKWRAFFNETPTTESDPGKKARAREAGATGWIVKPFNADKLVDAIRRVAA